MFEFLAKIFGSANERFLNNCQPHIEAINNFEKQIEKLSDEELKGQTPKLKQKLDNGATLDDIMHEAFATVREASKRTLGMRHYNVQMIGGIALHNGHIAEMKTGEGKTLVATSPLYLNALEGKGAHLITVNDYLASRDAKWMGHIYNFLGLSVGTIVGDQPSSVRQKAYGADITYGTNNEFGFDYLRDNMKNRLSDMVQRDLHYCIIDEVDSVLIDEARTPLIISGKADRSTEMYFEVNNIIPYLKRDEDYLVDEEHRSTTLTDAGVEKIEKKLGIDNLYDPKHIEMVHHVSKALQAHTLYKKDDQYIVHDGEVIIVDEFTGRPMPGRRWSDGLHQAVEAKEGVPIQEENQTLATVTFQNFFRMYDKLSGMTGTAETEAAEFHEIYDLETVVIPTNRPIARKDYDDVVYKSYREKFNAIVDQIVECHERGQPVLVGTTSVEKSEAISQVLKKKRIDHEVLNAKQHEREAHIVAQAGRLGAVTIATNMAGRGTDILLGGNPEFLAEEVAGEQTVPIGTPEHERHEHYTDEYNEAYEKFAKQCKEEKQKVMEAGGLYVMATERHESRRIDNQLRGRSGRQGDPGASKFFLSLEDDLLRLFGADRVARIMDTLKMPEGEPIEHKMVTRSIENAQKKVEARNFDIRKNLLEYDDVLDKQRKSVYDLRKFVLRGEDDEGHSLRYMALDLFEDVCLATIETYASREVRMEDWDLEGLESALEQVFDIEFDLAGARGRDAIEIQVWNTAYAHFEKKEGELEALAEKINERREQQLEELEAAKAQAEAEAQADEDGEVAAEVNDWDIPEELHERVSGRELFEEQIRNQYLMAIDRYWKEHLQAMDQLRDGIGMRGYAQKDPKQEYKKEGYNLFLDMMMNVKRRVVEFISKMEIDTPASLQPRPEPQVPKRIEFNRGGGPAEASVEEEETFERELPKIGRNDPCHCGSGRKYKRCCMRKDNKASA
ncbi:preprotein translocase subunit SecA [Persicimonas caeni]|jgi:preprotein translocase subunit SecA|uniref:Protein translocase subunit SecA n=1 Tax=Persicimonas caeni TaxID=2292766 RepID=A0A4Y6PRN5_PERCE|nr:preprotein translocase subunit SecA [Persicimonas caeni]QDG50992.1 preprotein translocase subunit SecA [Persicimonas caeni]QED32213.1 preprotein translocase subunit SecA [Persicimonas caeni]